MYEDTVRHSLNQHLREFGDRILTADGDASRALDALCYDLRDSDLSRDQLAALAAFAVRRLWHKRSDVVRVSAN